MSFEENQELFFQSIGSFEHQAADLEHMNPVLNDLCEKQRLLDLANQEIQFLREENNQLKTQLIGKTMDFIDLQNQFSQLVSLRK